LRTADVSDWSEVTARLLPANSSASTDTSGTEYHPARADCVLALSILPQLASQEPLATEHESIELDTVRGSDVSGRDASGGVTSDYVIAGPDSGSGSTSYVRVVANCLPRDMLCPAGSPSRLREIVAGDVAETAD